MVKSCRRHFRPRNHPFMEAVGRYRLVFMKDELTLLD